MGTSRRSVLRLASPFALLLVCLAPLGCYKPSIVDGGLRCNLDGGAKACPDGFVCDRSDGRCKRHLSDGGPDVSDAMDGSTDGDAKMCLVQPKAGCTPSATGRCDPTCQTGCPSCRQKCSMNTVGALTCNEPISNGYPKAVMEVCADMSEGFAAQTDNCGPGLVCIMDECFARCYQFCKNDGDCTNTTCTRDMFDADGGVTGQKVCDVPFVDSCVPLAGNQNGGCGPSLTMNCYLSSTSPTHTICDCPIGSNGPNSQCARSRDCNRGLACVDRGGAFPSCLQVCRLADNGVNDCPTHTPGSCHPYTGIPVGTTANPTYGYCF